MTNEGGEAVEVLNEVMRSLDRLSEETRVRVIKALLSFYDLHGLATSRPDHPSTVLNTDSKPSYSARPEFGSTIIPTPKQFLAEKQPKTDVERIACLAYYLTHFRDLPHFKNLDLAKLNTEAAQPKFSNTHYASSNALSSGYLAPALGGARQISAIGEQFVQALPDRDAAKLAMSRARTRKSNKPVRKKVR